MLVTKRGYVSSNTRPPARVDKLHARAETPQPLGKGEKENARKRACPPEPKTPASGGALAHVLGGLRGIVARKLARDPLQREPRKRGTAMSPTALFERAETWP